MHPLSLPPPAPAGGGRSLQFRQQGGDLAASWAALATSEVGAMVQRLADAGQGVGGGRVQGRKVGQFLLELDGFRH